MFSEQPALSIEEVLENVEAHPDFKLLSTRMQSEVEQSVFLVPSRNDDFESRSKKLIFRLVQSLHSCGSLSFRTEEIVYLVARSFNMHAVCGILPVSVSISFNTTSAMNPKNSETYIFKISNGICLWKLDQLYFLCRQLQEGQIDLYGAEEVLDQIDSQPPLYSPAAIAAAYALAGASGAMLFFNGDEVDGLIAAVLGLCVFLVSQLCAFTDGLPQIECFLSALVVSVVSFHINTYVVEGQCPFAQLFGGVVWLLPGTSIVMSLLEIYSQSIVYGSARLVFAISLACQLGFGMAIGCGVCYPLVDMAAAFTSGCVSPLSPISKLVFVPVLSVSLASLLGCAPKHFPGVVVVSGSAMCTAAWAHQLLLSRPIAENLGGILAAAVVTLLSRFIAYMNDHHYYIYLVAGIQVLVPGGIGVRGMSNMWSGNMEGGIAVTFQMCLVGVSLAMGVFLAIIPRGIWLRMNANRLSSIPAAMGDIVAQRMPVPRYPSYGSTRKESHVFGGDDVGK